MEVTYIGYAPRESAWGRAALVLGEGPFSNYSPQKAHLSVQRGSPRNVVSFFLFFSWVLCKPGWPWTCAAKATLPFLILMHSPPECLNSGAGPADEILKWYIGTSIITLFFLILSRFASTIPFPQSRSLQIVGYYWKYLKALPADLWLVQLSWCSGGIIFRITVNSKYVVY